jgi:4-hydroxybenzoyl-CoA thioesterase
MEDSSWVTRRILGCRAVRRHARLRDGASGRKLRGVTTYHKRYRWRFGDIDDAGIAYYPKFFHYFHGAFEDFWSEALGVPYPRVLHEEKLGFPAVHIDCDFLLPLRYGDEPWIHVAVLRIGTSSVDFGFWITLADGGPLHARAVITTVAIDMDTHRKQPVPERWRAAFERHRIDALPA